MSSVADRPESGVVLDQDGEEAEQAAPHDQTEDDGPHHHKAVALALLGSFVAVQLAWVACLGYFTHRLFF